MPDRAAESTLRKIAFAPEYLALVLILHLLFRKHLSYLIFFPLIFSMRLSAHFWVPEIFSYLLSLQVSHDNSIS